MIHARTEAQTMVEHERILLLLGEALQAQSSLAQSLSAAGYQVMEAGDLEAARKIVAESEPELVLFPDELSWGDSFDFADEVSEQNPNLPLILVGKPPTGELLLKGMHHRFVDYLSLPVEQDRLLKAIRRAHDRKLGWERWLRKETGQLTGSLNRRLSELETILKQVDDGIIVLDPAERVVMLNRTMRRAFDLGDEDVLGKGLDEVFSHEELLLALASGETGDGRLEVEGRDGRFYSLRVTKIREIGTVASLHDISYLKELDRLKGDFVSTVSHDLRSPLTAILGYVELIERAGEVNDQQAEFIRRVKSSVHATTDLIGDLLNLGRVEVGIVEDMQSINLQEIVSESVEAIAGRVEQKSQSLRMNLQGKVPNIVGSPVQLRQAVDNLIGNAVKYTPEEGEIRVLLREEDEQVILHVADNGPGIPTDEQGRIFEKFYRASNVDEDVPGSGLGLAIVKSVVDNHRGRIWLDSKPGDGSIFTLVLPVEQQAA